MDMPKRWPVRGYAKSWVPFDQPRREPDLPSNNDWMNDQLRELTGTTVSLDQAGEEIGAALRGQESPSRTQRRIAEGRATLDPEPPPTANIREWQRWATGVAPLLDDQGRLPGEKGYTRPAADSFDAMGKRNGRWSQLHRRAQGRGGDE